MKIYLSLDRSNRGSVMVGDTGSALPHRTATATPHHPIDHSQPAGNAVSGKVKAQRKLQMNATPSPPRPNTHAKMPLNQQKETAAAVSTPPGDHSSRIAGGTRLCKPTLMQGVSFPLSRSLLWDRTPAGPSFVLRPETQVRMIVCTCNA